MRTPRVSFDRWVRLFRHFLAFGALATVSCVIGFNCGRFEKHGSGAGVATSASTTDEVQLPIALLSAEQIFKSMISVSGVVSADDTSNPADELIISTYRNRSGTLPSGQDLRLMTAPMIVSVTNLASAICAKLVDQERATVDESTRLYFKEFNFAAGPSSVSESALGAAAGRMARNFWRRDIKSEELDAVNSIMRTDFLAEATGTSSVETRNLAIGTCTAMLSSMDALVY